MPVPSSPEWNVGQPSHMFTVRVWLEDLGDGQTEWRGQVRHILSGETRYFRDWTALVNCIIHIASSARDTDPPPQVIV